MSILIGYECSQVIQEKRQHFRSKKKHWRYDGDTMEIRGIVVVDVVTPYRSSTITDDDMFRLIQILCGLLSVWFESR